MTELFMPADALLALTEETPIYDALLGDLDLAGATERLAPAEWSWAQWEQLAAERAQQEHVEG